MSSLGMRGAWSTRAWTVVLATAMLALAGIPDAFATRHEWRATELLGARVVGRQGEPLGHVEELLIDAATRTVHGAVLEFGGILGLGEKRRLVPTGHFMSRASSPPFELSLTREMLAADPGFVPERMNAQFLRASDVIGRAVVDSGGQARGEIDDLVIRLRDGRIRRVVLEYDEALGAGSAPLSVRAEELSWPAGDGPAVLGSGPAPVPREGYEVTPSDARKRLQSY